MRDTLITCLSHPVPGPDWMSTDDRRQHNIVGETTAMTKTDLEYRIPAALNIADFDGDAFDDIDDNPEKLAYAFSPDAIREELAKNLPEIHESWVEEENSSFPSVASLGGIDKNLSVSTIDIGPSALPSRPSEEFAHSEASETDPSDSPEFTQISLSVPAEDGGQNDVRSWNENSGPQRHGFAVRQAARPPSLDLTQGQSLSSPAQIDPFRGGSPYLISPSPRSASKFSAFSAFSDASEHSPSSQTPTSIHSAGSQAATSTSLPNVSTVSTSPAAASSILLTEKSFSHRPHRSAGPSAFEKVRSKTRPTFLPPKSREEDNKHMSDWQHMMKQSRMIGMVYSFSSYI